MRLSIVRIALIPVMVLAAGCSSEDSSPGAEETVVAPVEIVTPELPTPVTVDHVPVTPLRNLETARIEVDSPDWMALENGSVWVKLDNGTILRVDPDRAEVVDTVKAAGEGQFSRCQGFGSSPGAVWSCSPFGPLQRVDSATSRTTEALTIEMSTQQGHLVVADDRLWVLTPDGQSIAPVDLATNETGEPLSLGLACSDLAASGTVVWAVCPWDDQVLAVDVTTGEVGQRVALDEPRQVAVGGDLWVAFAEGVAQIRLPDLTVTALYQLGGDSTGLSTGDDAVWVRSDGGPFLVGIASRSQQIFAVVTAPDLPSGGNSVEVEGRLWATAYDDGTLVQLLPPAR